MTADLCAIEEQRRDEIVVLWLRGEIDLSNAGAIETQVLARVEGEPRPRAVVLDLNEVEYLDSAALAAIERLTRRTRLHLVLAPTAVMHRTIMIAGLPHLTPVHDTVPEAVAAAADVD